MPKSKLGSDWSRLWASRQRRQGKYSRETLAAYFAAWRQRPTATNLLAWLAFRRDLGMPMPTRFVPVLASALAQLDSARRRIALGLLAESSADVLPRLDTRWLKDAAQYLPPVATHTAPDSELGQLFGQQALWRQAFADALTQAVRDDGVQLVGNAATLEGCQLGQQIDGASLVMRFNRFATGAAWRNDLGERLDVWVVSPGYDGPLPEAARWVVVSGPDMLFRLQDWRVARPFLNRGTPVLTIPLHAWRWCVNVLQAPPSAGVLLLHWLRCLNGDRQWQGVHSVGIGCGVTEQQERYHIVNRQQKAGERHAWVAENGLIQRWTQEGLVRTENLPRQPRPLPKGA